jgi:hypothetical protein
MPLLKACFEGVIVEHVEEFWLYTSCGDFNEDFGRER